MEGENKRRFKQQQQGGLELPTPKKMSSSRKGLTANSHHKRLGGIIFGVNCEVNLEKDLGVIHEQKSINLQLSCRY